MLRSLRLGVLTLALAVAVAAPATAATCGSSSTQPGQSPAASGQTCGVDVSATSGTEFSGTVATYTVSGAATLDTAVIDWGDGTTTQGTRSGPNANGSGTFSGSHVYAQPGTFNIRVTTQGTYNGQAVSPNTGTGTATVVAPDTDADGVRDPQDNCVAVVNPDQANGDKDALGDACDTDHDNDGKDNEADRCPLFAGASADGCPNLVPVVAAPPAQSIGRSSLVTVRAQCVAPCAKLVATGSVRYGGTSVKLGQATSAARPGQITLKLRVPAAKLRALRAAVRKGTKAQATVTVAAFTPSGRRAGQRTVRLALRR